MTLLVLFLTAPVSGGGFGWAQSDALKLYGILVAAMQVMPVIGGAISDRFFGPEKALRCGAVLMLLGHFALAVPHALPHIWEWIEPRFDAGRFLAQTPSLGIGSGDIAASMLEWSIVASFFAAVTLVALGNALFKPNISAILGRLPFADVPSRDAAFSLFHMFVNIGALLAIIVGGWVAAQLGYGMAFTLAGLGMLIALWLLQIYAPRYIQPYGKLAVSQKDNAPAQTYISENSASEKDWLFPAVLILATIILFGIIIFQLLGTLNLYAAERVESSLFGLDFPSVWILSMNPIVMLVVMPPLAKAWKEGRGPGRNLTLTGKASFGFATLALAFGILYLVETFMPDTLVPAIVLAIAIALLTLAELLVGPTALSTITRIVPTKHSALAVGSFYGALGAGGFLSGQIGASASELGYAPIFASLAAACMVTSATYAALQRKAKRFGI